jgi:hypothetical protein
VHSLRVAVVQNGDRSCARVARIPSLCRVHFLLHGASEISNSCVFFSLGQKTKKLMRGNVQTKRSEPQQKHLPGSLFTSHASLLLLLRLFVPHRRAVRTCKKRNALPLTRCRAPLLRARVHGPAGAHALTCASALLPPIYSAPSPNR